MIEYIIKSSISLLILYLVDLFFLHKDNDLIFRRYFILLSVIVSLTIPIIHFDLIQASDIGIFKSADSHIFINDNVYTGNDLIIKPLPTNHISISKIFLLIYFGVVSILILRFVFNLCLLINKIARNEKTIYQGYNLIKLDEPINIHSFFNSIFVNRLDFESHKIDNDLLNHEIAHLQQFHFVDIIFIELVHIFYWFNPLLVLYKSMIKANHEYLADKSVIINSGNITAYSEKIINHAFRKIQINLTSGFNYLLIKNRIVMLKKCNGQRIGFKKIVVLSALVLLIIILLPSFYIENHNGNITKREAVKSINDINHKATFHNGAIDKIKNCAKKSSYNFKTYVLIADLVSKFGHSTKPELEIAEIVASTNHECELFNDIAPLVFLHNSGPNEPYVELAKKASLASTETDISLIKSQIDKYKQELPFKSIEEALQHQTVGLEQSASFQNGLAIERKAASEEQSPAFQKALAEERKAAAEEQSPAFQKALAEERKAAAEEQSPEFQKALAEERKLAAEGKIVTKNE